MKSYCKPCFNAKYPSKPRDNPKLQPKRHIFDIHTRQELRECSKCHVWLALTSFRLLGGRPSNVCPECGRQYARDRIAADRDRSRAAARAYYAANTAKARARHQVWKTANKERLTEYDRQRKREHVEAYREYSKRRRARIAGSPVIERVDRAAIIARDGGICHICGLVAIRLTLDHVIPLSRGGEHTAANLKVACWNCNSRKQSKILA